MIELKGATSTSQAGPRIPDACPGGGLGWCNLSDDAVLGSDFLARLARRLYESLCVNIALRTRLRSLDLNLKV
jgi:hypothetical protein